MPSATLPRACAAVLAAVTAGACVPGAAIDDRSGAGGAAAGGFGPTSVTGGGGTGGSGEVVDPALAIRFEPAGGTFTDSRTITLRAGREGAIIHYTVDGSVPTRASPVYRGPITLKETTVVRAFSEAPGATAGGDPPAVASVHLRLGADAVGFTSNLPIVVLHTQGSGMLPVQSSPLQGGSISVFEPAAGGRASLFGAAAFATRAGLRVHGASSRTFPQKNYGVELRRGGSDRDDESASVLGMPAGADFVLVAPSWMDRSLVRTAVAFTLAAEMGHYTPRFRFCEVFLQEKPGPLGAAEYMGVYALVEKIGRGPSRVPVAALPADAVKAPAITGGYVFRVDHDEDDFRVEHPTLSVPFTSFGFVEPDSDDFLTPARQQQRAYLQGYLQEMIDALVAPNLKHPRTGQPYSKYLDTASFIDLNLVNALIKNVDALRFSSYYYKDREGPVKAGPLWDVDRSSGTPHDDTGRAVSPTEWARMDAAHPLTYGWWARLFSDPAFKTAYQRRFTELSRPGGTFSVAHIHALIDQHAAVLREAQKRHFARWTQTPPTGGSHDAEIKLLKDWFAARVPWMAAQLQ